MVETCSHCGKQWTGAVLKRCSICKEASYCGPECQNAAWKKHKKKCAPPVLLCKDVLKAKVLSEQEKHVNLKTAHDAGNWKGVLAMEGRLEEMMEAANGGTQPPEYRLWVLKAFLRARSQQGDIPGNNEHVVAMARLEGMRIDLLGSMERLRDQGEAMCLLAHHLSFLKKPREAAAAFQRARKVGEAHGFFSVECQACPTPYTLNHTP